MEAELVKRLALAERTQRHQRAEFAATVLTSVNIGPHELVDLRWDDSEPPTDPRRPSKREA
jgi:hypothetical protein